MDERPDLPGLENVKWRGGICGTAALVSFLGIFWSLVPFAAVLGYMSSPDRHLPTLLVSLAFLSIPLLPFIWALSTRLFDYCWETSPDGLTVKRVIGKVFLPWSQIDSVKTWPSFPWFAPCYVLAAGRKSAIIPCRDARLGASIWQHLRRRNLHERMMLPMDAQLLWYPIPDDVPDSVSWQDARGISAGRACSTQLLIVFAGGIVVGVLLGLGQGRHGAAAGAVTLFLLLRNFATTPHPNQIEVDEYSLRLHLKTSAIRTAVAELKWNALAAAKWAPGGLALDWPQCPRLKIPWDARDPFSTRLILTILKKLRSLPQPVTIGFPIEIARYLAVAQSAAEETSAPDEPAPDPQSGPIATVQSDSILFPATWSTRLRVTSTAKLAICVLLLAGVITMAFVWRNPGFAAFYGFWLLILLLMSFFAYMDIPVGYSIDDQFLEIRRKRGSLRVKISDLASARSEDASIVFQGAYTFRSKRWRPWVFGPYKSPGIGEDSSFYSFSTRREGRVVILEKNEGSALIVSPDDTAGFVRALNAAVASAQALAAETAES